MAKAAFDIRLQGFAPANRDATVELVNQSTGQKVERKPFLDGSLLVRDLDPGNWEMTVRHPNLINAIDRRVVRLFPQAAPTRVPVIVKPELFRDTPIRDIPDADIAPVQQAADTIAKSLAPIGGRSPGEVIRAEDWNVLVGAVHDLAQALGELSRLVSPRGHDHPEIADKIGEVQGNILRFTESFGASLLELRRDIENQNLRKSVTAVLDRGGATTAVRDRVTARIQELETSAQLPTGLWTATAANHGSAMIREIQDLASEQGAETDAFLALPEVRDTMTILSNFAESGGQTKAEEELFIYRKNSREIGSALRFIGT